MSIHQLRPNAPKPRSLAARLATGTFTVLFALVLLAVVAIILGGLWRVVLFVWGL